MPRDPFLDQSQDHGGPALPALREGQFLFNRRYELIRQLGAGGMGVVWLARDHTEQAEVALKFLPTVLVLQEPEMKRLRDEVRAGKELRHPRIVATYGLEVEGATAAIIMEFVEGKTLKERLTEHPRGFFEPQEITPWVQDVAAALTYLHDEARRIHRDIKPANIIVDAAGHARLMDFGISHRIQESVTRHSKTSDGHDTSSSTLAYASPQQLAGKLADKADDLYSFGATLYELLTGTPPFYRGDADLVRSQIKHEPVTPVMERRAELVQEGLNADVGEKVPAAVESALVACLAKERDQRPANAKPACEASCAQSGPLTSLNNSSQSAQTTNNRDCSSKSHIVEAPGTPGRESQVSFVRVFVLFLMFCGVPLVIVFAGSLLSNDKQNDHRGRPEIEIFFSKGSATITPIMEQDLKLVSSILADRMSHTNEGFFVEGFGDQDGSSTFADKFALGKSRSEAVADWLVNNGKIDRQRLRAISDGQSYGLNGKVKITRAGLPFANE